MCDKDKHFVFEEALIAKTGHEEQIENIKLFIPKWIFCPKSSSSTFLASTLKELNYFRVLDLGTGSGFLAIKAALEFAKEVIAIDIDENAIKSAKYNVSKNNIASKVQVIKGNLFEPIRNERFNLILANLPLCPNERNNMPSKQIRRSLVDIDHKVLLQTLMSAADHLEKKGELRIILGPMSNIEIILSYAHFCYLNFIEIPLLHQDINKYRVFSLRKKER